MDLVTLARTDQVRPEDLPRLAVGLWRLVRELHARGIAHRDISWRNIIIPRIGDRFDFGAPVLIDFGTAGHPAEPHADPDDPDKRTGSRMGAEGFRPPEVINDTRDKRKPFNVDLESPIDVFQWACSLYAAWSGHPPFDGRTSDGKLRDDAYGSATTDEERAALLPSDLEDMPAGLGAAVRIALSWEARDRRAEAIESALPVVTLLDAHEGFVAAVQLEAAVLRDERDAAAARMAGFESEALQRDATFEEVQRELEHNKAALRDGETKWTTDSERVAQLESQASHRAHELDTAQAEVARLTSEVAQRDQNLARERSAKENLESQIARLQASSPESAHPKVRERREGQIILVLFAVTGTYAAVGLLRLSGREHAPGTVWKTPLALVLVGMALCAAFAFIGADDLRARRSRGLRADGWAIGTLISAAMAAAVVVFGLALATGDARRVMSEPADKLAAQIAPWWPPPEEIGGWVNLSSVEPGACLKNRGDRYATVIRCDLEPDAEVFEVVSSSEESWPGKQALANQCAQLAAEMGISESIEAWKIPSKEQWAEGDRIFLCVRPPTESPSITVGDGT